MYVCMLYTEIPRKVRVTGSWNEEEGNYKQSGGKERLCRADNEPEPPGTAIMRTEGRTRKQTKLLC